MGLKTTNYEVKELGITIPTAYAQITSLCVDSKGEAFAAFSIQQNREDITNKNEIETEHFNVVIDKNQPLYAQIYNAAKEELFAGWEDDIVDEGEA